MNHQLFCTQNECKIITDNTSTMFTFDELDKCDNIPKSKNDVSVKKGVNVKKDHLTAHQRNVYEKHGNVRIKREHLTAHQRCVYEKK